MGEGEIIHDSVYDSVHDSVHNKTGQSRPWYLKHFVIGNEVSTCCSCAYMRHDMWVYNTTYVLVFEPEPHHLGFFTIQHLLPSCHCNLTEAWCVGE